MTIPPGQAASFPFLEEVKPEKRYGRRLLIVSIIMYLFPLMSVVLPLLFLDDFSDVGHGLGGVLYIVLFATLFSFLLTFLMLVSEMTLFIMTFRYLRKERLTGKSRMAAIISLSFYSLLTGAILGYYVLLLIAPSN